MVTLQGPVVEANEARKNYFREEYTLDYYLSTYDKPMVAIMDGITSIPGGGMADGSGWWSGIEYKYPISRGDREDYFRHAGDVDWLLS
jgi:hypothetical protein